MKLQTKQTNKAVTGFFLISCGLILSFSEAQAQTRAEQAAERRAMAEQRLEAMMGDRAERTARRTEIFTRMAETTPEMIQQRLDAAEVKALETLAAVDTEMVASRISEAGFKAGAVLYNQELENLTDEQVDKLVAAAARAASVTPEDVAATLDAGGSELSAFFDTLDADAIAAELNEIGTKALDLQEVR